jgi:hypothetical protein
MNKKNKNLFNFKTKGFDKLTSKEDKKLRDYIQYCLENHRFIYKEHILEILKINGRMKLGDIIMPDKKKGRKI